MTAVAEGTATITASAGAASAWRPCHPHASRASFRPRRCAIIVAAPLRRHSRLGEDPHGEPIQGCQGVYTSYMRSPFRPVSTTEQRRIFREVQPSPRAGPGSAGLFANGFTSSYSWGSPQETFRPP